MKCAGSKVEKNDLWNGIQERVPTWRCKFGSRVWRCSCNMDRGADYTNSLKEGPSYKTNQETHVSQGKGDNISLLLSSQKGLQSVLWEDTRDTLVCFTVLSWPGPGGGF